MASEPQSGEGFRFVVRDFPPDETAITVGVWKPSQGYLPSTELVLPRAVLADVFPDGPLVDVFGEMRQTSVVTFTNTGDLDLGWLFYQLAAAATVERALGEPIMRTERDYCGWSWPVKA
jgi:hypothetical protein